MTPASEAHFYFIYQKWFTNLGFHTHSLIRAHTHTHSRNPTGAFLSRDSCSHTKKAKWVRTKATAVYIRAHSVPRIKAINGLCNTLCLHVNQHWTVARDVSVLEWGDIAACLHHLLYLLFSSPLTDVCLWHNSGRFFCWDSFYLKPLWCKRISW